MRYKCPQCCSTQRLPKTQLRYAPYCSLKCCKLSGAYKPKHIQCKITMGQRARMLERAQYRCEICYKREQLFCVDHDHTTGNVRGILCFSCNSKLGFAENPKYSSQFLSDLDVITYLDRVPSYQAWLYNYPTISVSVSSISK